MALLGAVQKVSLSDILTVSLQNKGFQTFCYALSGRLYCRGSLPRRRTEMGEFVSNSRDIESQ